MLDSMLGRVYYSLKSRLFCKLFKQGEGAGFSFLASFPPSLLYYRPPHLSLSLHTYEDPLLAGDNPWPNEALQHSMLSYRKQSQCRDQFNHPTTTTTSDSLPLRSSQGPLVLHMWGKKRSSSFSMCTTTPLCQQLHHRYRSLLLDDGCWLLDVSWFGWKENKDDLFLFISLFFICFFALLLFAVIAVLLIACFLILIAFLLLSYCCFTAVLLLFYCCLIAVLLLSLIAVSLLSFCCYCFVYYCCLAVIVIMVLFGNIE